MPEPGLDPLDEHAAEDVGPGVVGRHPDADRPGRCGQCHRRRPRRARAWPAGRCRRGARTPRPPSAAPARAAGRPTAPPKVSSFAPAASAAAASSAAQSVDQRLVGLPRPVPLQHRELGMVQRPAFPVPEHAREGGDPALARRQQLLAGELRRGVQVAAARILAVRRARAGSRSACRCASLPGETWRIGVSTSTKPCLSNQRRNAATIRARANRNGRRSAWRPGSHHGEGAGIDPVSRRLRDLYSLRARGDAVWTGPPPRSTATRDRSPGPRASYEGRGERTCRR